MEDCPTKEGETAGAKGKKLLKEAGVIRQGKTGRKPVGRREDCARQAGGGKGLKGCQREGE